MQKKAVKASQQPSCVVAVELTSHLLMIGLKSTVLNCTAHAV